MACRSFRVGTTLKSSNRRSSATDWQRSWMDPISRADDAVTRGACLKSPILVWRTWLRNCVRQLPHWTMLEIMSKKSLHAWSCRLYVTTSMRSFLANTITKQCRSEALPPDDWNIVRSLPLECFRIDFRIDLGDPDLATAAGSGDGAAAAAAGAMAAAGSQPSTLLPTNITGWP